MRKSLTIVFLLLSLLFLHACSPQPQTDVKRVQETAEQSKSNSTEKKN